MVVSVDLVGRTAESAQLLAALRGPGTTCVLLEGEAGIGKSRLLSASLAAAACDDLLVLRTAPVQAEAHAPYSALTDLMRAVPADAWAALPEPQRTALSSALVVRPPSRSTSGMAVAAGVLSLLTSLAGGRRVAVVIDDSQWLDPASAEALRWALRRLDGENVACVIATRGSSGAFASSAVPSSIAPTRVRPDPMTVAEIGDLLRSELNVRVDRLVAGRIHDAAHGNPLWALELGRLGGSAAVTVGPSPLHELIINRLAILPERHERLLLAVALAHEPSPRTVVNAAKGIDDDLRLFVEDPGIAGFVGLNAGVLRFGHPLFAEVVRGRASDTITREMHRRLADVDVPSARIWHLALAERECDESLALQLDDAAAEAAATGALQAATELAEHAERLTPPTSAALTTRRLRRARWLARLGAYDACAPLVADLQLLEPGPVRDGALLLGVQLAGAESEGARDRQLAAALAVPDVSRVTKAELLLTRANVQVEEQDAQRDLDAAVALLGGEVDVPLAALLASTRAHLALRVGAPDHLQLMRYAASIEPVDAPIEDGARFRLFVHLLVLDELTEARGLGEELLVAARTACDEPAERLLLQNLGHLEIRAGRWDIADEHAAEFGALARVSGDDAAWGMSIQQRAATAGLRGDVEEAERLFGEAVAIADRLGAVFIKATGLANRGRMLLGVGRFPEALESLEASTTFWKAAALDISVYNHFMLDRAESLIILGSVDAGLRLLDELEAGEPTSRLRTGIARGRAQAAITQGLTADALAFAIDACDAVAGTELRLEQARALLVLGRVNRRSKAKRAAHDALTAAVEQFTALGAVGWAAQARDELSRVGLRPSAPDHLTETEARVADLAAAGHTNREIAERLFMAPKTVEAVMSRVFRKLGIRSRAELGRLLDERSRS